MGAGLGDGTARSQKWAGETAQQPRRSEAASRRRYPASWPRRGEIADADGAGWRRFLLRS